MGENTRIEWTHHTFNPWWGCTKVSPGCEHCYAESSSHRYGFNIWGVDADRRFFGDKHWAEPLRWHRDAHQSGERRRVFCASMADWAETHRNRDTQFRLTVERAGLALLIQNTPWLDWLLLTKRIADAGHYLYAMFGQILPDNLWVGTSVENQEQANRRLPDLLRIPAAVRFVSCEPLLSHVDLASKGWAMPDWVIVGGESGHSARPMHPGWARSLRDQCLTTSTSFFFKQWGNWLPGSQNNTEELRGTLHEWNDEFATNVGKKQAGRLLDGREWNEFPRPAKSAQSLEQGEVIA